MNDKYIAFGQLIKQLNQRAARAVVSQLGLRNNRLAEHLRNQFEQPPGKNYSFLADPVFEATFGWQITTQKMSQLAGKLLESELINALDNPPSDLKEHRFACNRFPYLHQLQSWETLLEQDWRSILVTSGTASGKTECFLIPILQDLVQEWKRINRPLIGVRALFLYPLNALINSQRQRLEAWTAAFQENIRFCLYNGETSEYIPVAKQIESPQQILSRTLLRKEPPPLLVTNATMLEYMLVRNVDQPILKGSCGKLRWIVLDEAHTYTGSQAAELTLLLRRVMHAFSVEPKNVRFIATSATIGDASEESSQKLRRFMSEIAGVCEDQIAVIHGERYIPELADQPTNNFNLLTELEQSSEIDKSILFSMMSKNSTTRRLRAILAKKAQRLSDLTAMLQEEWDDMSDEKTLNLLECCTRSFNKKGQPFLPLRLHLFERTLSGLWACCNPMCAGKNKTSLDMPNWKFGKVFINRREFCDSCQSPVYELITCHQCGTEYLIAEESTSDNGQYYLLPRKFDVDIDEFQLDLDDQEEDNTLDEEETVVYSSGFPRLLAPMPTERVDTLNPETREIVPEGPGIHINLIPPEPGTRKLHCMACDTVEHKVGRVFRFARLGAPFFLGDILPTLLEFTPPPDDEKLKKPFDGRRLLSFTDSRQGSARIAARLQQDADRNYIRSLLYHHLAQNSNDEHNHETSNDIQRQIQTLESLVKDNPNLEGTLRNLRAQAEEFNQLKVVRLGWAEAREKLLNSKEVKEWMVADLRRLTGKSLSLDNFADFCLYREFAHRPRRANSAETLGLISIRYPKIEKLSKCPDIWKQRGGNIDNWKDFLKLILDYHVRGNTAVTIHHEFVHWMGAKVYPKFLQGPGFSGLSDRKTVLWPYCKAKGTQSRFVKLLILGLNLNPDDRSAREVINMIFREAWLDLRSLFESFDNGYKLPLNQESEFTSPDKTWICPYTHRLLDITFKGFSPYTPNLNNPSEHCSEILMPRLPLPFWRDKMGADKSNSEIQLWLDSDPLVTNARRLNVWPNRSDRVAAKENWYAIAEHSAQQSSIRLRTLEEDFRQAKINILSCSTTMEMGIDIGGLSAIAMNNVPPSPANYLQRAGRSGRRDESTSMSLTLCRHDERGLSIFKDPIWPFEAAIPVPSTRLESKKLVQRHVNALLLSEYLKAMVSDITHLNCQWFFENEDSDKIPAFNFSLWLESKAVLEHSSMCQGLKQLVKNSILSNQSFENLIHETSIHIRTITDRWRDELKALLEEQELIKAQNSNWEEKPAGKGNKIQLDRMRKEYLLTELTGRCFLPGYGFPTDVVSFVNLTRDMLIRSKRKPKEDEHREDVVTFKQGYPSRELGTAIREYAPGAEIVLDGRVFESSGVTLNWHLPPGIDNVSEIQALRFAWFCRTCGASGTSQNLPQKCVACNSSLDIKDIKKYLQPGGFAVDINYQTHNDVSAPKYLPIMPPRITVNAANWTSLPNPQLGRYRYSDFGSILRRNTGINRVGYAVCLRCGRTAEMEEEGVLPPIFQQEHYRLRGGKDEDGGRICEGSHQEFAIQRDLWLASEIHSDVFELQLFDPDDSYPIKDNKLAYTLGFALRRALARFLGVRETEIGVCVQPATTVNHQEVKSIFLYDNVSQGAGYVDELREHFYQLLQDTLIILDCDRCDSACHHCLLTIDSQHHAENLDRKRTLEFLNHWLAHYQLPEELKFFGVESRAETIELRQALIRRAYLHEHELVQIVLGGDIEDWNLSEWSLLPDLLNWVRQEKQIQIYLPGDKISQISNTCGNLLAGLIDLGRGKFNVYSFNQPVLLKNVGVLLAGVGNLKQMRYWAAREPMQEPGKQWASSGEKPIIRNNSQESFVIESKLLDTSELRRVESGVFQLHLTNNLDGKIADFGEQFWSLMSEHFQPIKHQLDSGEMIRKIIYRDRYFHSPIHVKLLQVLLSSLNRVINEKTSIQVISSAKTTQGIQRQPTAPWHDWLDDEIHRKVGIDVLQISLKTEVHFELLHKSQIQHSRELLLEWNDGKTCSIRPDEGIGCWGLRSSKSFPFEVSVENQTKLILNMDGIVFIRQPELGTYINCLFRQK